MVGEGRALTNSYFPAWAPQFSQPTLAAATSSPALPDSLEYLKGVQGTVKAATDPPVQPQLWEVQPEAGGPRLALQTRLTPSSSPLSMLPLDVEPSRALRSAEKNANLWK